ncbi:MAG TPA: DUF456 domain-containing protein [Gemmatimonadales bacterium]|nr:DUF456 domain-containing protein [Gemmatimonadales bacterium]
MVLDDSTGLLLLIATGLIGLALIPFGLPGTWLILLGILGYGWITDFRTITTGFLVVAIALALVGEVLETWIGFRFAKRYGGSSRAGWGALIGGLIGAIVGVPVPVIGSVIGGFVGAFIGAAVFEYSRARQAEGSVRAGWGAVLGRATAAAAKIAIGVAMVAGSLFLAFRG